LPAFEAPRTVTSLALSIATELGTAALQADDLRLAVQYAGGRSMMPDLWAFETDGVWLHHTSSELSAMHELMSAVACRGFGIIVSKHVALNEPVVIEGDDILPAFALSMVKEYGERVRAAYLYEHDGSVVRESINARDRGILRRDVEVQEAMIQLAVADGERLRTAALESGFPVVAVRPRDSLQQRVLDAVQRVPTR
jgi:hypothetical protein